MSKIKKGMRVVVVIDNELQKGTVKSVYDWSNIAVVALDNGDTQKLNLWELGIEPVAEPTEQDQEHNEPVEKSEITITPNKFRKIATDTVIKLSKDEPVIGLVLTMFVATLHRALFFDAVEND
jgi:hypothetical protein